MFELTTELMKSGLELLKSATKYGPNIKAIAVTGSVNAMTTGMDIAERKFNSSSWLPVCPSFVKLLSHKD
jgi:hypothetical protein